MAKTPKCGLCRNTATYHDGSFHYCEKHKPIWLSDTKQPKPQPYTPGLGAFRDNDELTGLTFKPKRKR